LPSLFAIILIHWRQVPRVHDILSPAHPD
jgi:hypothetical protein